MSDPNLTQRRGTTFRRPAVVGCLVLFVALCLAGTTRSSFATVRSNVLESRNVQRIDHVIHVIAGYDDGTDVRRTPREVAMRHLTGQHPHRSGENDAFIVRDDVTIHADREKQGRTEKNDYWKPHPLGE